MNFADELREAGVNTYSFDVDKIDHDYGPLPKSKPLPLSPQQLDLLDITVPDLFAGMEEPPVVPPPAPAQPKIDPHRLAPLVYALADPSMPVNDPTMKTALTGLNEEYSTGHIGSDWAVRAAKALKKTWFSYYEAGADRANRDYFRDHVSDLMEAGRDHYASTPAEVGTPYDVSCRVREDIEFAHTVEEVQVSSKALMDAIEEMEKQGYIFPYGSQERVTMGEFRTLTTNLLDYEPRTLAVTLQDGDRPVTGNMPYGLDAWSSVDQVRDDAMALCTAMDSLPVEQRKALGDLYAQKKEAYLQSLPAKKRPDLDACREFSRLEEKQEDMMDTIRGIQLKMNQEKKSLLRSSPEYERMKKAVDEVCKIASSRDYHSRDGAQVDLLAKAMKELSDASYACAKVEATGNKWRTRGIERKNSALLLLHLTNPEKEQEIRTQVKDFRMKRSESRTQRSYEQLLKEEKASAKKRTLDAKLANAGDEAGRDKVRAEEAGKKARKDARKKQEAIRKRDAKANQTQSDQPQAPQA
ncbi:MAG: hypothetical protein K6G16_04265 [Lachnospiraceae bacterium]|nr:hypothetical protein [Lachnospiraceae bacterium]